MLTVYGAMVAMAAFNVASDLAMFTASVVLLAFEVIEKQDFLSGFGNSSVVTVGLLLVVAKGVEETGALERLVKSTLGKPKSLPLAQFVMMIPVLTISAFLSNTACVAMMIPIIQSWADSISQPSSQLLLPLSYVSMFGGCLSLIGSSNNLVAYEKAKDYFADNPELGEIKIGMFDVAKVGAPITVCGIIYMVAFSRMLLPNNAEEGGGGGGGGEQQQQDQRYTMCFWVKKSTISKPNDVCGWTPNQVSFNRPGLNLMARHSYQGDEGCDLGQDVPLKEGELLIFRGNPRRLAQLQKVPGLSLATTEIETLSFEKDKMSSSGSALKKRRHRRIVEAVVDVNSTLVGRSVKELQFRQVRKRCAPLGNQRHNCASTFSLPNIQRNGTQTRTNLIKTK